MEGGYRMEFVPRAKREFANLARPIQKRVARAIDALARRPRPAGAKLLSGSGAERIWRIRVGDHRVLYQIQDERLVVLVIRIAHRRDVYRSATG